MARVTVEDCVLRVPNRFDLVMLAAQRAREISAGSSLSLERDHDKNPVVALREIAEETIDVDRLGDSLIEGMQKHVEIDEPEEEHTDFEMAMVGMVMGETGEATVPVDALAVSKPEEAEEVAEDELAEDELGEGEPEGDDSDES